MIEYRTTIDGIQLTELRGFFAGWKSPLSPTQHYQILTNSSFVVLAYDSQKSKVVGFINALCDGSHFAFIPMLEVLPEYRKQGIGNRLMRRMLELLAPITCIDLTCDASMQGYYKRFGMLESRGMVIRKYLDR
ncbi:MAG: GNAT family N-acetyltransferase [bacterium]|nr:GNAT family N-acetyltransferase [bacterium]